MNGCVGLDTIGRLSHRQRLDKVPSQAPFAVELPLFSGPFRLLADLIFEHRVDVCDVPLARVTDEFVKRGGALAPGWALDEATWFLAVCATMLELKVGRLLPKSTTASEEELLGSESPDLLYARSLELVAFQGVADRFAELMAQASRMFPRPAGPPPEYVNLYPDPLEKVTPENLRGVALELLRTPEPLDISHLPEIRASVAEAIELVEARLSGTETAYFRDLIDDRRDRMDVVVRFLAVLELHREGKVEIRQGELFGDIEVRLARGGLPARGPG